GKSAAENDLFGALSYVDKATCAGDARSELADVDVSELIHFGHSEDREVESAAVIEVEHVGMVDQGFRVDRRTEIEAAQGYSAHYSRLDGHRHQVTHAFLSADHSNTGGHADAQIDNSVRDHLHGASAAYNFALVKRQ